jgi:hypothetical protein
MHSAASHNVINPDFINLWSRIGGWEISPSVTRRSKGDLQSSYADGKNPVPQKNESSLESLYAAGEICRGKIFAADETAALPAGNSRFPSGMTDKKGKIRRRD